MGEQKFTKKNFIEFVSEQRFLFGADEESVLGENFYSTHYLPNIEEASKLIRKWFPKIEEI
jgi:hypothetical protein